jgi:hypothetical protein
MGVVKAGITISAWPKPTGAERKIITSTEIANKIYLSVGYLAMLLIAGF